MRRALLSVPLVLATLAGGPASAAQQPPTMHRTQAGDLDAAGWTDASSVRGGFSVRIPCLFNEFSTGEDPAAPGASSHSVGCARADGSRFLVTRGSYRGGAASAQDYFNRARTRPVFASGSQTVTTFAGRPALDIVAREQGACLWMRAIRDGADNVILAVEGPEAICATLRPMATTFFAGLALGPGR